MIISYLRSAFRIIFRYKLYSTINAIGLIIAISSIILVELYIQDENSYEREWASYKNIYSMEITEKLVGTGEFVSREAAPAAVTPLIKANINDVASVARLIWSDYLVAKDSSRFYEKVYFADKSFLDIFQVNFIEGELNDSLNIPYSVIISEETRNRYFGSGSALNKTLTLDGQHELVIKGVFKKPQFNTHLNLDFIISIDTFNSLYGDGALISWDFYVKTYVKKKEFVSSTVVNNEVSDLVANNLPKHIDKGLKVDLVKIEDLHLKNKSFGGVSHVTFLRMISIFVLIVACINSINLNTAINTSRNVEFGVRKTLGAHKGGVLAQLFVESAIVAFLSMLLAILVVWVSLPILNKITEKTIEINLFYWVILIGKLGLLTLIIAAFSGLYSGFIFSKTHPIMLLRGISNEAGKSTGFRKFLLSLQFVVAISISIITLSVFKQFDHLESSNYGFESKNIIVLDKIGWTDISPVYSTLKTELSTLAGVERVSAAEAVPANESGNKLIFHFTNAGAEGNINIDIRMLSVDYGFLETIGAKLLSGRFFNQQIGADYTELSNQETDLENQNETMTYNVIINRAAVRAMNWPEIDNVINKEIRPDQKYGWNKIFRIVGVVDDINMSIGREPVLPTIYFVNHDPRKLQYAVIKYSENNSVEIKNRIVSVWSDVIPDYPIDLSVLDENIKSIYRDVSQVRSLLSLITVLAFIIAVIGCFSLASHSTRMRQKEVTIRKVLGSSHSRIILLFVNGFMFSILSGVAIGSVLAFLYVMDWFKSFANPIAQTPIIYLGVATVFFALAVLSIAFHAILVANQKPANVLRSE